jgi:hypothetical protein
MRGSGGSATDVDERPREGEGCSWYTSKGERREGKTGAAASGGALLNRVVGLEEGGPRWVSAWMREKEGEGGWRSGGRLGAVDNDLRPSGACSPVPRGQGSPGGGGGLTGGPWPQCWAAALADRRAQAEQCWVQTDSK